MMPVSIRLAPHHIIGHRGAKAEAPENTLGGFAHLRSLGIQKVELDLHLSQDNKLMVIHDTNTLRTTGVDAEVNCLSRDQLKTLNGAVNFKAPWRNFEPIPELMDVFSDWPNLEHIQIEVKPLEGQEACENLARQLLATCIALNLNRYTTVITSSDQHFIQFSKTINELPHGLVAEDHLETPLEDAIRLGCHLLVAHYTLYTEALAQRCHEAKMPVSLWTVNDVEIANILVERGAQSIITDHPKEFLTWIG